MPNLLSRAPLTEAKALAEVYVVYDNKDYRMSLETLISLVTTRSLGLDKVNNTSDAEKPISNLVSEALGNKADKTSVVLKTEYDALVSSLQRFVTLEQMNQAIATALEAAQAGVTEARVNELITAAAQPLQEGLAALRAELEEKINTNTSDIGKLKTTVEGLIDDAELTSRLSSLEQSLGNQISQVSQNLSNALSASSQSINDHISGIEMDIAAKNQSNTSQFQSMADQISQISGLIGNIQLSLANHTHAANDITGLKEMVEGIVTDTPGIGCNVSIVGNDW